jgi:hypothetical protein
MSTVWIVGRGIVGRRLERQLDAGLDTREVRFLDPRVDQSPPRPGDLAVLCHPEAHAPLAREWGERGVSVVTVGDDFDDAQDLLPLGAEFERRGTTLVVGAAMSPGLSGLLTRHLVGLLASVDEIHVAIHGTAGPACARSYHRSLSRRSMAWHDGEFTDHLGGSGRELCWFPEPVGAKDCFRADIADPLLLHAAFPDVARISARRSARRRDRFTARLPMLRAPHQEGGIGALRVEVRGANAEGGRECLIVGVAELVGTAAAATAATMATLLLDGRLPPGLVVPGQDSVPTLEALALIEHFGVRLQEFTGVPQRI